MENVGESGGEEEFRFSSMIGKLLLMVVTGEVESLKNLDGGSKGESEPCVQRSEQDFQKSRCWPKSEI